MNILLCYLCSYNSYYNNDFINLYMSFRTKVLQKLKSEGQLVQQIPNFHQHQQH